MQIAIVMANLMERLGFDAYYVHGGDFGHTIGTHMATYFDKEVLGLHTTFPVNFSKRTVLTWVLGGIWSSLVGGGLEDRMYPLKDKTEYLLEESGYMHLQGTKPDTIGKFLKTGNYISFLFIILTKTKSSELILLLSLTNLCRIFMPLKFWCKMDPENLNYVNSRFCDPFLHKLVSITRRSFKGKYKLDCILFILNKISVQKILLATPDIIVYDNNKSHLQQNNYNS